MPEFKDPQAEKHYYETEASQEEFLTWYQKQEFPNYPKPALTVDNVILRWYQADPEEAPQLQLLLIKRKAHPFLGHYALPGGFVEPDEDTTQATIREVLEETHIALDPLRIEQLETFASPGRDPRAWVVSVAHIVYLPYDSGQEAVAGDDASAICWANLSVTESGALLLVDSESQGFIHDLAFDHELIITKAVRRLSNKLEYHPTVLSLLPSTFTIKDVRAIFDVFNHPQFRHVGMTAFRLRQEKYLTFLEFGHAGAGKRGRSHKTYTYQLNPFY